jgi:hypothetical protein
MGPRLPSMRKLVVATVATGAMALGTVGVAGASVPTLSATSGTPAASAQLTPGAKSRLAHFSCSRAPKALTRIHQAEAGIAAGLPRLHAVEAEATAGRDTQKAARIGKVISRLGRPGVTARLQRLAAAIEAKCGVGAPATTPTTAPAP